MAAGVGVGIGALGAGAGGAAAAPVIAPAIAAGMAAGVASIALTATCLAVYKEYRESKCNEASWFNLPCNALGIALLGNCAGAGMTAVASGGFFLKKESLDKLKEIFKFMNDNNQPPPKAPV